MRLRQYRRSAADLAFAALLLAIHAFIPTPTRAQNIRVETASYGALLSRASRAAEAQNRFDWPRVNQGETGTQVHVTFNLGNADITLITEHDFGQNHLLAAAQKLARQAGYPNADFILNEGKHTTSVDIELNKYLQRPDKLHAQFSLNIGMLTAALSTSDLPAPQVLFIDGDSTDRVHLAEGDLSGGRDLDAASFLAPREIAPGSSLSFSVAIPVYCYAVLAAFALMMFGTLGIMMVSPWIGMRSRVNRVTGAGKISATLDPADLQKKYNRRLPMWLATYGLPLCLVILSLLGNPVKTIGKAFMLIDSPNIDPNMMLFVPLALFPLFGISFAASRVVERKLRRSLPTLTASSLNETSSSPYETPKSRSQKRQSAGMMALAAGMAGMPVFLVLSRLHVMDPFVVLCLMFGFVAVTWITAGLLFTRGAQEDRTELAPGNPHYEMVHEIADRADVKVRHVVVVKSGGLNAYASVFGTVGMTGALLEKMAPDEVRAIIAHEVGHLKSGHARMALLLSLPAAGAFFAAWFYLLPLLKPHVNPFAWAMMSGPMMTMVLSGLVVPLVVGPIHRRNEMAADRIAAEITGDSELVIRALRSLHTLNAAPHHLKPSDEALSRHPSLAHRIDALRRRFGDGLNPPAY